MSEYEIPCVGLAGASCSGKTTLAREIVRRNPQEITWLSFDEYWINIIPKLKADEPPDWESPESYDVARFLRDVQLLKRGETLKLKQHTLDSTTNGISERIITPSKLLLVEGFLAYYSPISRACFDRKIFIDLPEEEIIRRRVERSRITFGTQYEGEYVYKMLLPGLKRWVYPQRQYADLILDGLKPVDVLAQEVLGFLGYNYAHD